VPLSVLGLQAAIADGSEPTFDGQPMQAGRHLRWAFAPEFGFPPGAFWLCRRSLCDPPCGPVAPPVAVRTAIARQRVDDTNTNGGADNATMASANTTNPQGLGSAVIFNTASYSAPPDRCGQCCCCLALGAFAKAVASGAAAAKQSAIDPAAIKASSDPTAIAAADLARCECGHTLIELCTPDEPSSASAANCDCCRCSAKQPPPVNISVTICCCCSGDGTGGTSGTSGTGSTGGTSGTGNTGSTGGTGSTGTGTVVGTGWGPGPSEWGPPDECGWQLWGEPFTLPVTRANWPARYTGALDPSTNADPVLANRDVQECSQRLGTLDLLNGMSPSTEQQYFTQLRAECVRLVEGWPATSNYDVGLNTSDDGTAAPQLSLSLVSQLQMSALNPYLARVLGLYFVDTDADPNEEYQYCIVGVWAQQVPPQVLIPGGAPTGAVARGSASFDGMTITASPLVSHLFAWQSDGSSAQPTAPIQGVPADVATAFAAATAPLAPTDRPPALLAAQVNPPAWPFVLLPPEPTVSIALATPVAEVAVSIAGQGEVIAFANGTRIASVPVSGNGLTWYPLAAPDPSAAPIDQITVVSTGGPGSTVVVGAVASSPVTGANVGVRYALVNVPAASVAPGPMPAPTAPAQPMTIFRRRAGYVDPSTLTIKPSSFFEVQSVFSPLTAAEQQGDPINDPAGLPPPRRAVAYLAQRGDGDLANPVAIPRMITATPQPTPPDSPLLPAAAILRFVDAGLPDPTSGYQHRMAGFGLFGQLGAWSEWSDARGVEHIAAAPTLQLLVGGATQSSLDNSAAGGGAPDNAANPTAWEGGTLSVVASWTASSLLAYPDARTAQLTVTALDGTSTVLAINDFTIPAPSVQAYTLTPLLPDPDPTKGLTYAITNPPLTAIGATDPPALLILTGILADGTAITERFAVRPGPVDPSTGVPKNAVVATLHGGQGSRIFTNASAFRNQPAYLVSGVSVPLSLGVPLSVPIDKTSASGEAVVSVSTQAPFAPGEQIVDPNTGATRAEPQSNTVVFVGAQQLTPPQPPAVAQTVPTHIVHHLYYDPADYNGNANYTLPFDVSGQNGAAGYLLDRAPAHSVFIADLKRRQTVGLLDSNPAIAGRADLQTWIDALQNWLAAYNQRNGTSLTQASVLTDAGGQRGLIQHFYGGLLDDELRALADLSGNAAAFAQLNSALLAPTQPPPPVPPSPLTDTVNGNGFGRNLYGLRSANAAGSRSIRTPSVGPIYTRTVRASRAPVLYKVTAQPTTGAFILAWALDGSPDVAGYLVYRAPDPSDLTDLRWFGTDKLHPADPSTLAQPQLTPGVWQPLSLTAGVGDPRLIGVVNDPRAYARDYDGSDMGEVALPPGTPPDEILGVYRLDEFDPTTPASQPAAFNYWIPGTAGGTAQLVTDTTANPATSRVTGLRLGLGRGVAAVVVASYAGVVHLVGSQPVLRIAFIDGIQPGSTPATAADPNAAPTWTAVSANETPSYAIVAVDIAGNLSAASTPFSPPAFVPV
jgi:hypothetical protein